jgi:hypothetical protein
MSSKSRKRYVYRIREGSLSWAKRKNILLEIHGRKLSHILTRSCTYKAQYPSLCDFSSSNHWKELLRTYLVKRSRFFDCVHVYRRGAEGRHREIKSKLFTLLECGKNRLTTPGKHISPTIKDKRTNILNVLLIFFVSVSVYV